MLDSIEILFAQGDVRSADVLFEPGNATCARNRNHIRMAAETTLPLYYNLAPNHMLVPHDIMEKEFFALAETEGIADIEELNKILERAVNLKNFLKGKKRVTEVAKYVAERKSSIVRSTSP